MSAVFKGFISSLQVTDYYSFDKSINYWDNAHSCIKLLLLFRVGWIIISSGFLCILGRIDFIFFLCFLINMFYLCSQGCREHHNYLFDQKVKNASTIWIFYDESLYWVCTLWWMSYKITLWKAYFVQFTQFIFQILFCFKVFL